MFWLRGQDSNLRPRGYEPRELPLLHPAMQLILYQTGVDLSIRSSRGDLGKNPSKTWHYFALQSFWIRLAHCCLEFLYH